MDKRIEKLIADVTAKLPEAAKSIKSDANVVILHQDAFAADFQDEEFTLLGKFIKYIGLFGKEIHIIGKNDDTVDRGN